jgi:hypothetical protein
MCYPFLEYADDVGRGWRRWNDKYMAYGLKLSTVRPAMAGDPDDTDMPLSPASAASEYVGKA